MLEKSVYYGWKEDVKQGLWALFCILGPDSLVEIYHTVYLRFVLSSICVTPSLENK